MTVNGAPYLVENLPGLWVTVDNGGETPLPSANDGGAGVLTQSRRRSRLDNSKSALWSGFSLASLRPTSGSAHTTNDLTAVALRVRGMWSGALLDLKVATVVDVSAHRVAVATAAWRCRSALNVHKPVDTTCG